MKSEGFVIMRVLRLVTPGARGITLGNKSPPLVSPDHGIDPRVSDTLQLHQVSPPVLMQLLLGLLLCTSCQTFLYPHPPPRPPALRRSSIYLESNGGCLIFIRNCPHQWTVHHIVHDNVWCHAWCTAWQMCLMSMKMSDSCPHHSCCSALTDTTRHWHHTITCNKVVKELINRENMYVHCFFSFFLLLLLWQRTKVNL